MFPLSLTWIWPETPIGLAITIVVAILARWLLVRGINTITGRALDRADRRRKGEMGRTEQLFADATGAAHERHAARTATMGSMLRSITNVVIATVATLTVLALLGIPMEPLLASAGIGGVALGFGAQSLVKDYLSGIFMIAEDQYGVGDLVDLGEVIGTVEEVGLRVTQVRDSSGQVWYVRNGEIVRVGNSSQGWSTALIDVPVSVEEDPAKVIAILGQVVADVDADEKWNPKLLETPTVAGVNSIAGGTMTIRIVAKSPTNQQWGVQREILERAVMALNAEGVRGPAVIPTVATPPAAGS